MSIFLRVVKLVLQSNKIYLLVAGQSVPAFHFCRLSYTLQNRPAEVKVENLEHNLAIVDARRWSIKCTLAVIEMQTLGETLVEVEAQALLYSLFKTCQETLSQV